MIPYVIVEPVQLGPFTLQPFGTLMGLGGLLGFLLARWRAKRLGLDDRDIRSFIKWILVAAILGAKVLSGLFEHSREVLADPERVLSSRGGLSSFGGFIGASLGAFAWKYYTTREVFSAGSLLDIRSPIRRERPVRILPYADVVMAVFPVAWAFGRAGCAVIHDHPGLRAATGSWLTVAYGPGPTTDFYLFSLRHGVEARYDLGLLEMLFTVILAGAFALTWRRVLARGWYLAAACIAYAPVRFALDFLRVSDPERGDLSSALLTPVQWASISLFVVGVWLALGIARTSGDQPRESATDGNSAAAG